MIECETAAVVVTMRDSERLGRAVASVRSQIDGIVVVVYNDPSRTTTTWRNGVLEVGAGMNLGWAAGVHAGLLDVRSQYVWAIQDDLVMQPGAFSCLRDALVEDPGLASVRPLPMDAQGIVNAGYMGAVVDDEGRFHQPRPAEPTRADDLPAQPPGSFLASSGQFIRRRAWDEVGGFDPWFFPWGYIDIDFGRALLQAGWRFDHVPAARMVHEVGASTSSLFRTLMAERNRQLFAAKWAGADAPDVHPLIIDAARTARGRRDPSAGELRGIVGIAAADCTAYLARGLSGVQEELDEMWAQLGSVREDLAHYRSRSESADHEVSRLRSAVEFLSAQFETAAAQRDEANDRLQQIVASRAWRVVSRYWRLKARL